MNMLETLEALAEKATERPWRRSEGIECSDVIVAGDDTDTYYRGRVIAESLGLPDIELIVAAVNALPDLLAVAKGIAVEGCLEGSGREWCWEQPGAGIASGQVGATGWPREEWCAHCRILEPLLREAQP